MGKRKSSSKPQARRVVKLDTVFDCLFCNHEKSVVVKMEKDSNIGHVSCTVCPASYQSPINTLSDPIDVYSDWIDACEKANKAAAARKGPPARRPPPQSAGAASRRNPLAVPDELSGDDDEF